MMASRRYDRKNPDPCKGDHGDKEHPQMGWYHGKVDCLCWSPNGPVFPQKTLMEDVIFVLVNALTEMLSIQQCTHGVCQGQRQERSKDQNVCMYLQRYLMGRVFIDPGIHHGIQKLEKGTLIKSTIQKEGSVSIEIDSGGGIDLLFVYFCCCRDLRQVRNPLA